MEKQTVLKRVEINSDGSVGVLLYKQVVDGETVLFSDPHRFVVGAGEDANQVIATVSAHLVDHLGYPAISESDAAKIANFAGQAIL